jgi:hypothetical protein
MEGNYLVQYRVAFEWVDHVRCSSSNDANDTAELLARTYRHVRVMRWRTQKYLTQGQKLTVVSWKAKDGKVSRTI